MANKLIRNIPNAVTSCNLLMGCVATMFAFAGDYTRAFLFIIFGATFDFFDGLTARALHVSSPIGKELDSLADDVTFGVAPAAMVFSLLRQCVEMHDTLFASCSFVGVLLPFIAFLLAAFSALRLAKFNLDERQTTSFIGLATPANALFWGGVCVGGESFIPSSDWAIWVVLALVGVFSWLLVAEIPMFSLKFKKGQPVAVRIVFLAISAAVILYLLITKGLTGGLEAFSFVIALYIVLSLLTCKKQA